LAKNSVMYFMDGPFTLRPFSLGQNKILATGLNVLIFIHQSR